MYKQGKYPIVSKKTLAKGIFDIEIYCPHIAKAAKAGQFAQVQAEGFFLCILYSLVKCLYALVAIHFIVCSLWLDSRADIVYLVDYSLVELPYSLSRTLERLAVFLELLFLDVFRNIVKLWVKTHY